MDVKTALFIINFALIFFPLLALARGETCPPSLNKNTLEMMDFKSIFNLSPTTSASTGKNTKTAALTTQNEAVVSDSRHYPYRTIGRINFNGTPQCTGTIVGECFVLTAPECVTDINGNTLPSLSFLSVDPNGKNLGLETKVAPHGVLLTKYGAVLKLEKSIGKELGWMGLKSVSSQELENKTFSMVGYSPEFDPDMNHAIRQDKVKIVYKENSPGISTVSYVNSKGEKVKGPLGAAVWKMEGANAFIVGINTRAGSFENPSSPLVPVSTKGRGFVQRSSSEAAPSQEFYDQAASFMKGLSCDGPVAKASQ